MFHKHTLIFFYLTTLCVDGGKIDVWSLETGDNVQSIKAFDDSVIGMQVQYIVNHDSSEESGGQKIHSLCPSVSQVKSRKYRGMSERGLLWISTEGCLKEVYCE